MYRVQNGGYFTEAQMSKALGLRRKSLCRSQMSMGA